VKSRAVASQQKEPNFDERYREFKQAQEKELRRTHLSSEFIKVRDLT